MDSKRILYVSQEIHPYLPENEISKASLDLPKKMNEMGHEVRVFMPRYGLINERRHQLHEVIRLSGINIIVNDMDQPLIIKVASVPSARMQVYFIDNEEYFKRKATFYDEGTRFFEDNDQRAIFFCRGVIETVKKLGWAPDIIHCHGWLASFMPLYLRKFHYDDPMFADSKIVYSVYTDKDQEVPATLTDNLKFDGIDGEDLARYENASVESLNRAALSYSDGAVIASEGANTETKDFAFANVSNTIDISQDENPAVKVGELYEQIAVEESVA
ncbi:MAG TPA: glycogen synthase [Cryomorphaceae bacterium]|nr:glycogen synthase [Owenweeksia sp.]HAD96360.1 glycogen synthase [Cryomorphaceae bacterium]